MAAVSGLFVFVFLLVLIAPIALYALTAAEADDTDTVDRSEAVRQARRDADGRWDDRDDDRRNGWD